MKITKTSNEAKTLEDRKALANIGCYTCPCCGETKLSIEYFAEGVLHKGLIVGICRTWAKGLFKFRYMRVDCYYCDTCGAKWESDPYEV